MEGWWERRTGGRGGGETCLKSSIPTRWGEKNNCKKQIYFWGRQEGGRESRHFVVVTRSLRSPNARIRNTPICVCNETLFQKTTTDFHHVFTWCFAVSSGVRWNVNRKLVRSARLVSGQRTLPLNVLLYVGTPLEKTS